MTHEKDTTHDDIVMDEQQKRSAFFDQKIALRNLAPDQKAAVAEQIIGDMTLKLEYWTQMALSIIIATLGLLINATPVVIGAMLIAPILRPISGISFAITTGNRKLFLKSFGVLAMSILGGIAIGFILTLLIPLSEVTPEISMRTSPTLIDLGIAGASGVVAFLALGRKKMAAGLAGVAMAASLIPPLAVIGIGIGFGSLAIAKGSFLLFSTNLIAIIFGGILIFYLFGFYPTQKDGMRRSILNFSGVLIMMIGLSIPLASSFVNITRNISISKALNKQTTLFLQQIDQDIDIIELQWDHVSKGYTINLEIQVPQSSLQYIDETKKLQLTSRLADILNSDIQLYTRIIPVTTITKSANKSSITDTIKNKSLFFIESMYHNSAVLTDSIYHDKGENTLLIVSLFTDADFPKHDFLQQYKQYIQDLFPEIDKVMINRQHENIDRAPLTENQAIQQEITTNFQSFFPETILHKLEITSTTSTIEIFIEASTPMNKETFGQQVQDWEQLIQDIYDKTITSKIYINRLELVKD